MGPSGPSRGPRPKVSSEPAGETLRDDADSRSAEEADEEREEEREEAEEEEEREGDREGVEITLGMLQFAQLFWIGMNE